MSNDALKTCMFLKLDGSSMKMIEALQTHLTLEYDFLKHQLILLSLRFLRCIHE